MKELIALVRGELSGSKAKSFVAGIARYHRIQGSPMMRDAAEHVMDSLRSVGMDNVEVEQFPADGRTRYWTYTAVMGGWDVRSPRCWRIAD